MDGQKEYDNIDDELNAVLEQSFAKANLKRPLPPPLAAESAQLSSAPQSDRPPKNAAAAKPNNVVPYPGPTYREERNGDRLLPVSDVGERGLLCALLLSPAETAKLCANRIAPRMFMHPAYARLYELVFEWTEAGQEVNLNWLVERIGGMKLLEELGGSQANTVSTDKPAADIQYTCADISKARRLLNYHPKVSVREGVNALWEWYITRE